MRHWLSQYVYLGIGGFLHATNSAAGSWAESVERGREIAQANCAGCHAVGADGESPNPISALPRPERHVPGRKSRGSVAEGIVTSHDNLKMPEFEFESGQIGDFIGYLKTL
ncbi:MAG: c-type cytochrome [Tepidamorphaceae bacterium]